MSSTDAGRARMANTWWTPKAEKLTKREWERIAEQWYQVDGLGAVLPVPPADSIKDLPDFSAHVAGFKENVPNETIAIPGLRSGVIFEANMLLLKAINVLGGAQLHVANGACCWSLSSGYHAAFFASKAILHLFGVTFIELDKTFLVDVWHAPERQSKKSQRRGDTAPFRTLIIKTPKTRLDHQPIWAFFQRMLRQVLVDAEIWPIEIVELLKGLQDDEFAGQRNRLHYEPCFWPEPAELDVFSRLEGFGSQHDILDLHNDCDADVRDFSVRLGYLCVWLALQLFSSLTEMPVFVSAYQRQLRALEQECHALYRTATLLRTPPNSVSVITKV